MCIRDRVGTIEDYKKPLSKKTIGFSEALEHISRTAITLNANASVPAELKSELFALLDKSFTKQFLWTI